MATAIKRTVAAGVQSLLDDNVIDWSWFVRVDVSAPVGTKRYTDRASDFTGDIDGSSQTWSCGIGLVVGRMDQGRQFMLQPSEFSVANLDYVWSGYANSPGIRNAVVQIYAGWFDAAGALAGSVKIYHGKIDNHRIHNRAELALKPWQATWAKKILLPVNGLSPLLPAPLAPKEGETIYWNTAATK